MIGEFSYNGRLIATTFTIGISHHGFSADESNALIPSYAAMATPFALFLDEPGSEILTPIIGESFFFGGEFNSATPWSLKLNALGGPSSSMTGWSSLLSAAQRKIQGVASPLAQKP